MRRNRRTIYAKSRAVSSGFFPLRVFGNINTFTVVFDIPCAELSVQMEIRGDYTVGQIKDNLWSSLRLEFMCVISPAHAISHTHPP